MRVSDTRSFPPTAARAAVVLAAVDWLTPVRVNVPETGVRAARAGATVFAPAAVFVRVVATLETVFCWGDAPVLRGVTAVRADVVWGAVAPPRDAAACAPVALAPVGTVGLCATRVFAAMRDLSASARTSRVSARATNANAQQNIAKIRAIFLISRILAIFTNLGQGRKQMKQRLSIAPMRNKGILHEF